jgi:hypothetical protein
MQRSAPPPPPLPQAPSKPQKETYTYSNLYSQEIYQEIPSTKHFYDNFFIQGSFRVLTKILKRKVETRRRNNNDLSWLSTTDFPLISMNEAERMRTISRGMAKKCKKIKWGNSYYLILNLMQCKLMTSSSVVHDDFIWDLRLSIHT